MPTARHLYAALDLLDRQLVDRHGRPCGKVDDVELERDPETGQIHVSAILAGPGVLANRLGRRRFGSWLEAVISQVATSRDPEPLRIPFARVTDVKEHVSLAVERGDLATFALERWVGEHIIRHVPGSGRDAPG